MAVWNRRLHGDRHKCAGMNRIRVFVGLSYDDLTPGGDRRSMVVPLLMNRLAAAISTSLFVLGLSAAAAQEPTLATVLDRAATYVADFERQLSGIVAEERYVQEVKAFSRRSGCPAEATYTAILRCRGQLTTPIRLELKSDLLLVQAARKWVQFRDVFEADGVSVRDRPERLTRLFLVESAASRDRIGAILKESARYNIGDIQRNINTPVFALQILERSNQPRFKFKRSNDRVPDGVKKEPALPGAFRTSTEVWAIEYEEKQPGTIIRTTDYRDLPSRGRFWIEPDTGHVLISELVARNRAVHATVDVSYQSEPLLGLLVPIEMRERYDDHRGARIDAVASYGRFRQFQVNTNETFLINR